MHVFSWWSPSQAIDSQLGHDQKSVHCPKKQSGLVQTYTVTFLLNGPGKGCLFSLRHRELLPQKEHWDEQETSSIFFFFVFFSFVFLSVFSATSIDYSSFADRCNSWIELIKLKAQTIRRGSIKTSRRLFLPRYDNLRHISDFPVVNSGVSCPAIILQIPCRMNTWAWKLPTLFITL